MPTSQSSRYIVSRRYDWPLFLLPPVLALGLGGLVALIPMANKVFGFWGQEVTVSGLAIGIFIHSHLVIVFFAVTAIRASSGCIPGVLSPCHSSSTAP